MLLLYILNHCLKGYIAPYRLAIYQIVKWYNTHLVGRNGGLSPSGFWSPPFFEDPSVFSARSAITHLSVWPRVYSTLPPPFDSFKRQEDSPRSRDDPPLLQSSAPRPSRESVARQLREPTDRVQMAVCGEMSHLCWLRALLQVLADGGGASVASGLTCFKITICFSISNYLYSYWY